MEKTQQHGLGVAQIERRGEVAISAMAAKAKAEVEARYVIALQRPRNIMDARAAILDACKRPRFAECARYAKPVGGQKIDGFSIRFAETAIQAMRNITVETTTIWEDDEKRTVHIAVTDLESNLSYGKDVTIAKTVERRKLKDGQAALAQRLNSYGDTVYIVAATEDEIANKVAASESKIIRNCGLRLIPQDILDEAEDLISETRERGGGDPAAEAKKIADAFNAIGIRPLELAKYLGHDLTSVTKKELSELRDIYSTIKDGEASWSDYTKEKAAADAAKTINVQTTATTTAPQPQPVVTQQASHGATPAETGSQSNQSSSTVGSSSAPGVSTETTVQQQLAVIVLEAAGSNFDAWKKFAREMGHMTEQQGENINSFDEVPEAMAKRFVSAKSGMIRALKIK